jgi:hypothetical protein
MSREIVIVDQGNNQNPKICPKYGASSQNEHLGEKRPPQQIRVVLQAAVTGERSLTHEY